MKRVHDGAEDGMLGLLESEPESWRWLKVPSLHK